MTTGRSRFIKLAIVVGGFSAIFFYAVFSSFSAHYRIGLDLQEKACFSWSVYLVELDRTYVPKRGDYVAFVREVKSNDGKQRRVMFAKRVEGSEGDVLEVKSGVAYLNKSERGTLMRNRLSKTLPSYDLVRTVQKGEFLFFGDSPFSYDSRYFGPVPSDQLVGKVIPII